MIDIQTIQRVKDATDIVDVVGEFVSLRKAGTLYKGLCPFHHEKTPSFVVTPARQTCHCFSCGKGGDAIRFLMELEQMTYPEAIKWLARRAGIEIKETDMTDEQRAEQKERESMFIINRWAADYFKHVLHDEVDGVAKGMAYLRSRGMRDDIIERFELGYALDDRDAMSRAALKSGYEEKFLLTTGLSFKTDDGRLLDRYRGRVIFPVHSVSGRVVAFGGRILGTDKKLAKYVNSPESVIYSKRRELYGLYQAKNSIVREGFAFLVEGYTDVISMYQSGVKNVVASSGTSLTTEQVALLHRFTERITVLYDGDAAGIKASLRGIDMLLAEGLKIKVLLLPDGDDPDSFARKHTAADFRAYIEAHQTDFITFKTQLLLQGAANDPLKRAELITDVVRSISVMPSEVVRNEYVHLCATMLSVREEVIMSEMSRIRENERQAKERKGPAEAGQSTDQRQPAVSQPSPLLSLGGSDQWREERELITWVIRYGGHPMLAAIYEEPQETSGTQVEPVYTTVAQYIDTDLRHDNLSLRNPIYHHILQEALDKVASQPAGTEKPWDALDYFIHHPDPQIAGIAAQLGIDRYQLTTTRQADYVPESERLDSLVPYDLMYLKLAVVKRRMKEIPHQISDPVVAKDSAKVKELLQEFQLLHTIQQELSKALGDRVIRP